jgi:hypothetical protein
MGLDRNMRVQSNKHSFRRFAMYKKTGELLITDIREEIFLFVGYTRSVSTCERMHEIFLFHAKPTDGEFSNFSRNIFGTLT